MATDRSNIKQMRECVREAFDNLGGVEWLVGFAKANHENARVFVSLVGKLIPQELTGKDGAPLEIVVRHEHEEVRGHLVDGEFRKILEAPAEPARLNS